MHFYFNDFFRGKVGKEDPRAKAQGWRFFIFGSFIITTDGGGKNVFEPKKKPHFAVYADKIPYFWWFGKNNINKNVTYFV